MTDVTSLLAGIKTREEAATEGPWASYGDLGHEVFRNTGIEDEEPTIAFDIENAADAAFIAAARTDVPRLVAALEGLLVLHRRGLVVPTICLECGAHYPCPTITAVAAALGGGE